MVSLSNHDRPFSVSISSEMWFDWKGKETPCPLARYPGRRAGVRLEIHSLLLVSMCKWL